MLSPAYLPFTSQSKTSLHGPRTSPLPSIYLEGGSRKLLPHSLHPGLYVTCSKELSLIAYQECPLFLYPSDSELQRSLDTPQMLKNTDPKLYSTSRHTESSQGAPSTQHAPGIANIEYQKINDEIRAGSPSL